MNAVDILREGVAQGASDVHIVPLCPPIFRLNGQMVPLPNHAPFTADQAKNLILQLLTEPQRLQLAENYGLDFSLTVDNMRYRGNVLFQRNGLEAALRIIPTQIPGPEELMLPPIITDLANIRGGLILVTGPTGRVNRPRSPV